MTRTNTSDNISSDTQPEVNNLSGTSAVAGDVIKLYADSTLIASATLTSENISNGINLIPSSSIGSDGTYNLTALITDIAGNAGTSSSAIVYKLDTSNDAPTATLASASASGFVISASDTNVQPDWNSITLDSGSISVTSSAGGTNALNNGSQTTFSISAQAGFSFKALTVSDSVASAVAVTDNSVGTYLVAGSDFGENIGASSTLVNISYGFGGNDNILGGNQSDYIFAGDGDDTITAGLGSDEITGGQGADIFVFNATNNGLDTIKDFDDSQNDVLDLDAIISGGLYNSAGSPVVDGSTGEIALADVDGKFVYYQVSDISAAITEANLFGSNLEFAAEGAVAGIEFILAVGESSGTDGVKLYQVTDGNGNDDMAINQIALIENNSLADIITSTLDVV